MIFHFVTREPSSIELTGVVTTDEVRVGAMTQGHLRDLMVGPGDTVKKGEMLARIEPEDAQADFSYYKNTENASAAAVDESVAQLELLEMQTREQIHQADANLAVSRAQAAAGDANLEQARLELDRQKSMRERQLNSQQALDQARTAHEAARAAAESGHKQIDARRPRSRSRGRTRSRSPCAARRSRPRVASSPRPARRTQRAKVRLAYTEVTAPIDGIVDVRAALAGEVVNPGATIVTLIDPDDLWIRADVEETYVEKIRAGDKVTGPHAVGTRTRLRSLLPRRRRGLRDAARREPHEARHQDVRDPRALRQQRPQPRGRHDGVRDGQPDLRWTPCSTSRSRT